MSNKAKAQAFMAWRKRQNLHTNLPTQWAQPAVKEGSRLLWLADEPPAKVGHIRVETSLYGENSAFLDNKEEDN